ERLAKADASNTDWQQNLAASHDRLGEVLRSQGNLGGALESYKAAFAIAERLANTDASNTGWQLNLGASHDRVGGVLQAQGDRAGARTNWGKALAIDETLAATAEESEGKNGGKLGPRTARALGNVAWRALLVREFKKALAASERAHALAPDLIW